MDDLLRNRISAFLDTPHNGKSVRGSPDLCVGTTIGRKRRENQDRALVVRAFYGGAVSKDNLLAVICDGMGGLRDGGTAASIAMAEFCTAFLRSSKLDLAKRMTQAAQAANDAVYHRLQGQGGTTLSALCDDGQNLLGLNIGDSRLYGFSRGKFIDQISTDDVLGNVVRRDEIDDDQAGRLVQYVGMGEGLLPHLLPVRRFSYDLLILATDGVHSSFNDSIANRIFNTAWDVTQLVRDCVNLSEITGGSDNGTIIAIDVHGQKIAKSTFPGLSLQFVSPYDRLEIWAPTLSEKAGLTQDFPKQDVTPPEPATAKGKPAKRPKKAPRKKSTKEESLPLPLQKEDDVDVYFPNSGPVKDDDSK